MKILAINICNLNSLVGRHVIDFRTEPLHSAGLYAIVGPTGSGKSTVLDAITLALYGRTERDTYGAEVMSHGTGECYAEVEFETGEGVFLSRWERRRARQRPDGNLQTPQLQLSRYDGRDGSYRPLPADRLNEVKQLTVEKIGLDYDQFVRSVMLTQGQFARFLSSSTKERADILEKITGTAIYNRISQAAFERHKQAREAFEKLREDQRYTHPLSDEERGELQTRLDSIAEELGHLRPRQEELRQQTELYKQLERSTAREHEARKALDAAAQRSLEVKPRSEALAASRRIAPLREPLRRLEETAGELKEVSDKLARRTADREAKEKVQEQAVEAANLAAKLLADHLLEKPARDAALVEASGVERSLALLERDEETARPRLAEAKRKETALTADVGEATRRKGKLEELLRGRRPEEIEGETEKLEMRMETLRTTRAELGGWHERVVAEERLDAALAELQASEKELAGQLERQAKTRTELTRKTADMEARQRLLRHTAARKGLQPHRAELEEGQPCPLCGATHHPDLEVGEQLLDEDLRVAEGDVERAATVRKAAEQAEQAASYAVVQAQTRTETFQQNAERLRKLLGDLNPGGTRPTGNAEEILAALGELDISGNEARDTLSSLRKLRTAADELRQLLPELTRREKELKETALQLAALSENARQREQEVKELVARRRRVLGCDSVEEARRSQEHAEAERRRATERAEIERERTNSNLITARELEGESRQRHERLQKGETELKQQIGKGLTQFGLPDIEAARRMLLSPEQEEAYRLETERVERELHSLQTALAARISEGATAATAVENLPAPEVISGRLAELEQAAEALNREHGSVQQEVTADDQRRAVYQMIAGRLEAAERDRLRWARLNDLIGQKDGVKFSRFAQTLTLRRLVEVGNRHLRRINERYRMRHRAADDMSRENLELEIIDTFQNDNRRPMATLSGGETFIVSLALALGLSELASGRTNIQSLFIDEGFGTLDEKILDDAVSALEQLQGQGKTIGLISHVKELRERIYCQIRLESRGSGRSHLSVFPEVS